jgi:hypothetical protein
MQVVDQQSAVLDTLTRYQYQLLDASVSQIGCLTLDFSGNIDIGHLPAAFELSRPIRSGS